MNEQNKLDEDVLRRYLIEHQLLDQADVNRNTFAAKHACNREDLDELLVALAAKRGLTLESLNRIRREGEEVAKDLREIAIRRNIKGKVDSLDQSDLSMLPALIIDAQLRWRQNSEALRQVRGRRVLDLHPGKWLLLAASIVALIAIAYVYHFVGQQPNLGLKYELRQEPLSDRTVLVPPVESPTRAALVRAALGSSMIFVVSIVLLIVGVALFVGSKTLAGKGTAALLGLSGLSLFPIKDVKMFENAFKEIRPTFNFELMKPVLETRLVPYEIGSFVEGSEDLHLSATSEENEKKCSRDIRRLADNNELAFIIVVGHVDKRELKTEPRRIYGSNTALAYRRAIVVRDRILKDYSTRVIMLAGGPIHVGSSVETRDLEDDRKVEVFPYAVYMARGPDKKQ